MSTRRTFVPVLACTALLLARGAPVHAAIDEIEATGRYSLGDNDTRMDGHRLALMDAKRTALEKAGTYVESITEVKDFQLTRDDIRTYTAGIVQLEEIGEPKWELIGHAQRCTVTVKVRVDKSEVANRIATLRQDKEATQQLKDARAKTLEHEKQVTELNKQLKKAKKGSPAAKRAKESRDNALAGIDAQTLRAQGAAAATFSRQTWDSMRGYVNRNVDLHGCMPFKTAQTAHRDGSALMLAMPAIVLAACRSRKKRPVRRAPHDTTSHQRRDLLHQDTSHRRVGKD